MAQIISISIDVTKIPKDKIIVGKKGKYVNLQISVNDEKDQYENDCSVSINQTKEERADKEPKIYLGNGRIVWTGQSKPKIAAPPQQQNNEILVPTPDDDLPF